MKTNIDAARDWRIYANNHLQDGDIDTKTVELIVKYSRVEALKEALSRINDYKKGEPEHERSYLCENLIEELIEEIEDEI